MSDEDERLLAKYIRLYGTTDDSIEATPGNPSHNKTFQFSVITSDLTLKDVYGVEAAKNTLKDVIISLGQCPESFAQTPRNSVLLVGVPGAGKTFLVKAIAAEANNLTVLSVSCCELFTVKQDDAVKIIRLLFDCASSSKPGVVFIDDIDFLSTSLISPNHRFSNSAKRIRTELVLQIQGVVNNHLDMCVLGATSLPWKLDSDLRRCFDKILYISLPDVHARASIIRANLVSMPNRLTELDYNELSDNTNGFSPADLCTLVRDACMEPLRQIQRSQYFKVNTIGNYEPCNANEPEAQPMEWMDIPVDKLQTPDLTMDNFLLALQRAKPSVCKEQLEPCEKFMTKIDSADDEEETT